MKVKIKHGGETFVVNVENVPTKEEAKAIVEKLKADKEQYNPQQSLDVKDKVIAPFEWLFDSPDVVKKGADYLKENVNPDSSALFFNFGNDEESKRSGADFAKKAIDFAAPTRFDIATLGLGGAIKGGAKVLPKAAKFAEEMNDLRKFGELGSEAGVLKIGGREAGKNPRLLGTNPRAIKEAEKRLDEIVDGINAGETSEAIGIRLNLKPGTIDAIKKKHKIGGADKEIEDAVNAVAKGEEPVIDSSTPVLSDEVSLISDSGQSGDKPPLNIDRDLEPLDELPQSSEEQKPKKSFGRDLLDLLGPFQRTLQSMGEMSAPLRQGRIPTLLHPSSSGPAFKNMFKAAWDPQFAHTVTDEIGSRPFANIPAFTLKGDEFVDAPRNLYKESKLGLNDPTDQFDSGLAHRLPGIGNISKRSEAAYNAYLDTLRANEFDRILESRGFSPENLPDDDTIKDVGNLVNTLSGYGTGGNTFERAVPALQKGFYSPRYQKSIFDILNPGNYLPGVSKFGPVGRSELRKDIAKFGAGAVAGLEGLDYASDDVDVTWNPLDSDFGKIKIGDTRLDPLGGFAPMGRFAARTAHDALQRGFGDDYEELVEPVVGNLASKNYNTGQEALRFGRSKLAPGLPSFLSDTFLGEGRNVVGEEIRDMDYSPKGLFSETDKFETPYLGYALGQTTPMYYRDLAEIDAEENPGTFAAAAVPGFFGVGAQTYEKRQPKDKNDPMAEIDRMYKKIFGQ